MGDAVSACQVVQGGQRVVDRDQRSVPAPLDRANLDRAKLDVTVLAHQRRRGAPPKGVVHEVMAVGVLTPQGYKQRPGSRTTRIVGHGTHARVGVAAESGTEHAGDLVHGVVHRHVVPCRWTTACAPGSTMVTRSALIGASPNSRSASSAMRCGDR